MVTSYHLFKIKDYISLINSFEDDTKAWEVFLHNKMKFILLCSVHLHINTTYLAEFTIQRAGTGGNLARDSITPP